MKKQGQWSPSRVFGALGRIGYNPVSALLDIVDNSVSAGATTVNVDLAVERIKVSHGSRLQITTFSVVDNGRGMDEAGIDNALTLGSSPEGYGSTTLSKFGLGLKSAAASLGRKLTIISRVSGGEALQAVLDHDELQNDYEYDFEVAGAAAKALLDDAVGAGSSGTIIRIEKVHTDSMPKADDIIDDLRQRGGTIFLDFLAGTVEGGQKLKFLVRGENVEPRDPLFRNEIVEGEGGNLDETSWDGVSVKWIERSKKIQLNNENTITATVAATQLPHPPSFATIGGNQAEARDKYNIGAKNYGFYIYRNGRLISWADSLGGLVTQDQDLYSFRGVLELDKHSDDLLNLDVTKSRLHLSEIARTQLAQIIGEAKKKSIAAWQHRSSVLNQMTGKEPHQQANEEINRAAQSDAREEELELSTMPEEERKEVERRKEKENADKKANPEEQKRLEQKAERVQFVHSLPNNMLWERARHPALGDIVRLNQSHRFFVELVDLMPRKSELIKVLDVLFFGLAKGESKVIYSPDNKADLVEKVLSEYREQVGNALSELIRKIETSRLTDQSE